MASLPPPYPSSSPRSPRPATSHSSTPTHSPPPQDLSSAVNRIRTLETYNAAHVSTIQSMSALYQYQQLQARIEHRRNHHSTPADGASSSDNNEHIRRADEVAAKCVTLQAQLSRQYALVQHLRITNESLREQTKSAKLEQQTLRKLVTQRDKQLQQFQSQLRASQAVAATQTSSLAQVPLLQSIISEQKRIIQEQDVVMEASAPLSPDHSAQPADSLSVPNQSHSETAQLRISNALLTEKDKTITDLSGQLSTNAKEKHQLSVALQQLRAREEALNASLHDAQQALAAQKLLSTPIGSLEPDPDTDTTFEEDPETSPDYKPLSNQMIAKVEVLRKLNDSLDIGLQNPILPPDDASIQLPETIGQYPNPPRSPSETSDAVSDSSKHAESPRQTSPRQLDSQVLPPVDSDAQQSVTIPLQSEQPDIAATIESDGAAGGESPLPAAVDIVEATVTLPPLEPSSSQLDLSTEVESESDTQQSPSDSPIDSNVVLLRRALEMARNDQKSKERELASAQSQVSMLQKTCWQLRSELNSSAENCRNLERRVHDDLEPALKKALTDVKEKVALVETGKRQLSEHTELSEKNCKTLETDLQNTMARLEVALASLEDTQSRLSTSEQRNADAEEQISILVAEKKELLEKYEAVATEHEHTKQSLVALQKRFTDIEMEMAKHEQIAADAIREKQQLDKLLVQCRDRQDTAEKRATRRELMLREHVIRNSELKRECSVALDRLREKSIIIERNDRELSQFRQVLTVRDEALQDQAKLSCERENLFNSLSAELKSALGRKEDDLREQKEVLKETRQQVAVLSRNLSDANAKLVGLQHELEVSHRSCRMHEEELRRKDAKFSESQEEITQLSEQLKTVDENLRAKDVQISSQFDSIVERGQRLTSLGNEKSQIEALLESKRDEINRQAQQYQEMESQYVAKCSELDEAKSRWSELEVELSIKGAEIESLKTSLSSVQQELTVSRVRITEMEREIEQNVVATTRLDGALASSKHQYKSLESHLDGQDTVLKEYREKEEEVAARNEELNILREQLADYGSQSAELRAVLASRTEEVEQLRETIAALESTKAAVTEDLEETQKARLLGEEALKSETERLESLEKTSAAEITGLKDTIITLQKTLDATEVALSAVKQKIVQTSTEEKSKQQELLSSQNRGDRLLSKFISTQNELLHKTNALSAIDHELIQVREALKDRELRLKQLEDELARSRETHSRARARGFEYAGGSLDGYQGEGISAVTQLEANERAIMNLHNWCCFINGKLHGAEEALSEREADLEVSAIAFRKLEMRSRKLSETIAKRQKQLAEMDASQIVDVSELRAKIQTLKARVETVNNQIESTLYSTSPVGGSRSSFLALSHELDGCSELLKRKELELVDSEARRVLILNIVKEYEQEILAIKKTIDSAKQDFEKVEMHLSSEVSSQDGSGNSTVMAVSKDSGNAYLLSEVKKLGADLLVANETVKTWEAKVEELQPLADLTLEAQMSSEMLTSQLALKEKETSQQIDLLKTQLEDAIRERDAAERRCSDALFDKSAIRATLQTHEQATLNNDGVSADKMCTVTFTLSGVDAPGPEIIVYIIGSDVALGQWDPSHRLPLRVVNEGQSGAVRKCIVTLAKNTSSNYKYVADGANGEVVWEGGGNRSLELKGNALHITSDIWRAPV